MPSPQLGEHAETAEQRGDVRLGDDGHAMRDSVLDSASEWVGLVYGDDGAVKDPIQVIQTPAGGTLPQMTIADYMDRMIATLVRGGDLSTISRDNSTGSNPKQNDADALLEDDRR